MCLCQYIRSLREELARITAALRTLYDIFISIDLSIYSIYVYIYTHNAIYIYIFI